MSEHDHDQEDIKALPAPSLEENPNETPTVFTETGAPDVQFLLATYIQCIAEDYAKGGDTRYKAQNAMVAARHALGVLVALGIMESDTKLKGGEPLWLSPAVPPMGVQSTKNATLQG